LSDRTSAYFLSLEEDVMHKVFLLIGTCGLCFSTPATAAYEFYVKVKGAARDAPSGPIFLKVESSRDDDGDGKPDEGVLRIVCARDQVQSASFHYNVKSPRDSASGMASGKKRTHHPVTFVKEWGPSTPQFFQARLRTLVTAKSKPRSAISAGWIPVALSNTDGLCAAATASLLTAGPSKRNQSHDQHELEKISRKQ
jgi:hypothetical protein